MTAPVSEPADPGRIDSGKEFRASAGIPIVPAMDGFRALAIAGIFLLHLLATAGMTTDEGARTAIYGVLPNMVEVLFVLSGFVVFLPTVVRGEFGAVGSYALRRGARLLPAYWLALFVLFAMLVIYEPGFGPPLPGGLDVFTNIAVLTTPAQLYDPGIALGFGIDGVLWTLTVEIAFYIVLPFVALAFLRRPLAGVAIAAAITIGWKLISVNSTFLFELAGREGGPAREYVQRSIVDLQPPAFALQFALGMAGAIVFVRLRERFGERLPARRVVAVQAASLAVIAVCAYLFGSIAIDGFPARGDAFRARHNVPLDLALSTAIATFMVATAFAPRAFQMPFAARWMRSLGDISYGIYLIHVPMMVFVLYLLTKVGLFDDLGRDLSLVLSIPVIVLYGYLSARFLEQPIRDWAHRFGRRRAASGGPDPQRASEPASRA